MIFRHPEVGGDDVTHVDVTYVVIGRRRRRHVGLPGVYSTLIGRRLPACGKSNQPLTISVP